MNKQDRIALQKLSVEVGKFIRYWGFRQIHGEVWSAVYLARQALSATQICEVLDVSKALVSPALQELEAEGLIRRSESENLKTKRYEAEENITKVIHGVLRRREKKMMDRIQQNFSDLYGASAQSSSFDPRRLNNMKSMIDSAQLVIDALLTEEFVFE